MKMKGLAFAAMAILICSISIKPAMAYFTATKSANGKLDISLEEGELTPPEEDVEEMVKHITLTNTGECDVYVRVLAIYPEDCGATLLTTEDWTENEDGYYYYNMILAPEESTSELQLQITYETDLDFNVIILQEATKVIYDDDGNPTADWESRITVTNEQVVPVEQVVR